MDHDADLIAYYDAEARARTRSSLAPLRTRLRRRFATALRVEEARTILDVGAGPGLDATEWAADGFATVGLDLTHANGRLMRERELTAVTGSIYHLPFASLTFDALWTMSTFVHVPLARTDEAIAELVRVVRPGGPLGIGTWGGRDFEGTPEFGKHRPFRFFSLASHDRWCSILDEHGQIEQFETFETTDADGWEYQFAVLRTPT